MLHLYNQQEAVRIIVWTHILQNVYQQDANLCVLQKEGGEEQDDQDIPVILGFVGWKRKKDCLILMDEHDTSRARDCARMRNDGCLMKSLCALWLLFQYFILFIRYVWISLTTRASD